MNERFAKIVEALEPTFQKLVQMTPLRVDQISGVVPERGIYLFSEGPTHLYVGRTNSLKKRIQNHGRAGNTHHKATFAFRIARLETGIKATYKSEGSRDELEKDPTFGPAFVAAKARIRGMDLRFVEEQDPTRQALLEIYAATVLETPFNDLENH